MAVLDGESLEQGLNKLFVFDGFTQIYFIQHNGIEGVKGKPTVCQPKVL